MRFPNRLLTGFLALAVASLGFAQRPIGSVTYTPDQERVEGDSPVYHFHVVDVKSPRSLVPGVTVTPTVTWIVEAKPAGVTDAEALSYIEPIILLPDGTSTPLADDGTGNMVSWVDLGYDYDESIVLPWLNSITGAPTSLTYDQPDQVRTVGIIFRGSEDAVSGAYGYRLLIEDWPREDEGVIRNAGTFINATLGDPVAQGEPPVPGIASPEENELFTYTVGGDPVIVPILVTGQAEENYPVTDFKVEVSDRGDITDQVDILGLDTAFVTGSVGLEYTAAGLYDITVTATNSVGEGFTSVPFEVIRVVPPPTISIDTPTAGQVFTYTLGVDDGATIPVSVTAETLEDGGPNEGIQTLTASIGGSALTLGGWSVGDLNPTGTIDWFATEGTYTINAATSTVHGSANTAVTFTVEAVYPDPTVDITSPDDGESFQRIAGGAATVIPFNIDGGIVFGSIENVDVSITAGSGNPVDFTASVSGEGSGTINVTGGITATGSDSFTIAVTVTSDQGKTASDSVAIMVNEITATPPTVGVSLPNGNSYTFESGSGGVAIPVDFTSATDFGTIDSLTATINTVPSSALDIDLTGIGTSSATGTSGLQIATAGTYTITATATTIYGQAVASTTFTVEEVASPVVTILTPDDGFTVNRFESDPASEITYTFESNIAVGTINALEITVNGTPVSATISGVGSATVTGSGLLTSSDTESLVVVATATSDRGETAFDQITVNVIESDDPIGNENCTTSIRWLRPITLGKTWECGSTLPIKFRLFCEDDCEVIQDPEVVIAVSLEPDGEVELFTHGQTPNGENYKITGNKYHKNYVLQEEGRHEYRVEVFRPVAPGSDEVVSVGSKLFRSDCNKSCGGKSDKSQKSGKSGKSDKSDKSKKSDKSDKSGKSYKSDKSDKSGKSDKWGKSDKSDKSQKSYKKSDKSGKSGKSDRSGKSDKSGKSSSQSYSGCWTWWGWWSWGS